VQGANQKKKNTGRKNKTRHITGDINLFTLIYIKGSLLIILAKLFNLV
jgi:hypothetical protein